MSMQCGRNGCGSTENRVDGYCSIYCRDIDEAYQEIERLEKIVFALPTTADGVPIVPGIEVWDRITHQSWIVTAIEANEDNFAIKVKSPPNGTQHRQGGRMNGPESSFFSSREAAEEK